MASRTGPVDAAGLPLYLDWCATQAVRGGVIVTTRYVLLLQTQKAHIYPHGTMPVPAPVRAIPPMGLPQRPPKNRDVQHLGIHSQNQVIPTAPQEVRDVVKADKCSASVCDCGASG